MLSSGATQSQSNTLGSSSPGSLAMLDMPGLHLETEPHPGYRHIQISLTERPWKQRNCVVWIAGIKTEFALHIYHTLTDTHTINQALAHCRNVFRYKGDTKSLLVMLISPNSIFSQIWSQRQQITQLNKEMLLTQQIFFNRIKVKMYFLCRQ